MQSEKQINAAADKAMAALGLPSQTNERYWSSIKAVAMLCRTTMPKPEIVQAMPELFRFIERGMAAQQAVDTILSKANAAPSEGNER
jgi:hypothetical protein